MVVPPRRVLHHPLGIGCIALSVVHAAMRVLIACDPLLCGDEIIRLWFAFDPHLAQAQSLVAASTPGSFTRPHAAIASLNGYRGTLLRPPPQRSLQLHQSVNSPQPVAGGPLGRLSWFPGLNPGCSRTVDTGEGLRLA